jgi:hypothetical protein
MYRKRCRVAACLGVALLASGTLAAVTQTQNASTIEAVRRELMQLPYYGVFDFIAFGYEKGTVTLVGYAYRPSLRTDAERAVRRASGVDEVVNKIEELPVSQMDDDIRWRTYYAIYRDPFLARYAPGGGLLWGHRHPFGGGRGLRTFGPSAPFPGMEPAGDYPIRIIVRNGRVTLMGVVDSENDKTRAEMRARQVTGTFGVENNLMVDNQPRSTSKP